MLTIRRWWGRHGLRASLVIVAIVIALGLRQTQGTALFEVYRWLTLPFQPQVDVEQLALENAAVRELQARVVELESQNQRLKQLLDYSEAQGKGIVAPVIGRSADHWWQQITLGRGSRDGIQVGDVVSGTGGLVGRVIQVTPNTSRVLLITDPTSQVGVTVSRSRVMGVLRGQSGNRAMMQFFEKVPEVRPGDTVVTSAISQLFPEGLPVGQVESVDFRKSPAPEAVIELTSPIGYLEWVTVSSNPKTQRLNGTDSAPSSVDAESEIELDETTP